MIAITSRKGQKIALFGLGGSGIATARALMLGGAEVVAFDDNPASVEAAAADDIPVADLKDQDFSKFDALVLAPGVPLTHPKPHWSVKLAAAVGLPILGDVGLFAEERRTLSPESKFVAITGTNGKSTTTALISHVLEESGLDVQMGGNIGKPVLSLEPFSPDRVYVVECSSYQIDLAPHIGASTSILLNLAPDHLDRHGSMQNYAGIKERLVIESDVAIVGVDDPYSSDIYQKLTSASNAVWPIAMSKELPTGIFALGDAIWTSLDGEPKMACSLSEIQTLRGRHNAQNACAAYGACKSVGLSDDSIQTGMNSFLGLTHRMEIVGNVGTTVFVNDSKGTNADAAAMALSSFDNIYWIVGGLAKEGGIEPLRSLFGRVSKAFLIGEAAPEFAATLGTDVEYEISETIEVAVHDAAAAASADEKEAVVLLSPACASFDQYRNFEIRGNAFKEEVLKLGEFQPYTGAL